LILSGEIDIPKRGPPTQLLKRDLRCTQKIGGAIDGGIDSWRKYPNWPGAFADHQEHQGPPGTTCYHQEPQELKVEHMSQWKTWVFHWLSRF